MTHHLSWEDAVQSLIDDPAQAQTVLDCYYDPPLAAAAARYHASEEWQALSAWMPRGAALTALDLGAGNGIGSYALAKQGFSVTAVEPDPSNLVGGGAISRLATEQQLPIEVVSKWGESLPFPDASFDLAFVRQVLHHAQSLPQLVAELFRVLKPGGRLLAVRDHVVTSEADLPAFYDRHPLHHLYGGEHAYTRKAYRAAIEGAGFRIVKEYGSLESAINLAPHDRQSLKALARQKVRSVPGGGLVADIVFSPALFPLAMRAASAFDRRPGRLVTFIADRPR